VPQSPGKGKKIPYEKKDVYNWAIGLEFAEFGLDPTVIKPFIEAHGHFIQRYLDDCPDKYLFFLSSFSWEELSKGGTDDFVYTNGWHC
jgi:hypothetical protein